MQRHMLIRFLLLVLVVFWCGDAVAQSKPNPPQLTFERAGYWLVNPASSDVALHMSASDMHVKLSLYRLTKPELLTQVMTARAARSLDESELLRRVADGATPIWQGDLSPDPARPTMKLPLDVLAGEAAGTNGGRKLDNGVYVLTARAGNVETGTHATQWFMHTSLDMATRFYGHHALATFYDMATRRPVPDLDLTWLDATGKPVGDSGKTDVNGTAWLDRPQAGNDNPAPVLLMALAPNGRDMAFAPVPQNPSPMIERALILPDSQQTGVGQPVSLSIVAPDASNLTVRLNGQKLALTQIAGALWRATGIVPVDAAAGNATVDVMAEGDRLLARKLLLVTGNTETRLTWLQKPATAIGSGKLVYKFVLRGKNAAGKTGNLIVTAVAAPGADAPARDDAIPVVLPFTLDKNGAVALTLDPAHLPWRAETAPTYARLAVTFADAPVGDSQPLTLYPARTWLELTPGFADSAVAEGATARFVARVGSADGKPAAHDGALEWQLAREAYKFEWYQADDGRWTYRTKTSLTQVAGGRAIFTKKDQAAIAVPVGAGRYRLTVADAAAHLSTSMGFSAGWWLAPVPAASPERIVLKAQLENGAVNGKPHLAVFVDPPFAARVWLTAATASGARTVMQDVPDEGAFIYIEQPDLPPGQPLTLNAFAISANPEAALAQAAGSLTQPVNAPLKVTPATLSVRQPTGVTLTGFAGDRGKAILQVLDDDDEVVYATAPLDIAAETTDGQIHATLPPMAIDTALTLRVLAGGGTDTTVTDLHMATDGDIVLETALAAGNTLRVTILSQRDVREKLRLSLAGVDGAVVSVPSLQAGKPQTVKLSLGTKPGQKDLLLRLDDAHGTLAARPLRVMR